AVAHQAGLGVALDDTLGDVRTGDVAPLGGAVDLADLGGTELHFLVLRLEHALERALDIVDGVVNHRVELHVHALAVREFGDTFGRTDVEADDDRVVHRGQVDVVLRNGTHTTVDDTQLNLVPAHI